MLTLRTFKPILFGCYFSLLACKSLNLIGVKCHVYNRVVSYNDRDTLMIEEILTPILWAIAYIIKHLREIIPYAN